MDDITKIVITAISTLTGALVVGIVTWTVQARREHSKWVRERRFELYSEISNLTSHYFTHSELPLGSYEQVSAEYEKIHAALSRLDFMGPSSISAYGVDMLLAADALRPKPGETDRSADRDEIKEFAQIRERFTREASRILKFDSQ